jgi:hypothetical protein
VDIFFSYLKAYGFSDSLLRDDGVTVNALEQKAVADKEKVEENRPSLDLLQGNIESLICAFLKSMSTWYFLNLTL